MAVDFLYELETKQGVSLAEVLQNLETVMIDSLLPGLVHGTFSTTENVTIVGISVEPKDLYASSL